MTTLLERYHLALTAIRFRAAGKGKQMGEDVIRIADDALAGVDLAALKPVEFDVLRLDGKPWLRIRIASIETDLDDAPPPEIG